ncbi:sulfatase [Luteolibacter flavescens]|uniref:Sulfatase n=1 Tax=Luteolibacter flavescens TaxID=1859460 RepID=A0ABT3FNZ7_9BACT|nr:sulfatase [Luteolibacter flavescens]MCW1884944.1 sulfatase [Luteolibacter flavescens]
MKPSRTIALIRGILLVFSLATLHAEPEAKPQQKPNFVLIIADDCTWSDLEIHGGQAKTPHLMKLAAEGMKFERCFQSSPTCSPTRHNLYTGLHPVKSGAWPNHTMAYPDVKSIAHYLQAGGYRTHLSGKTHIQPKSVFPFEYSAVKKNPDLTAIRQLFTECGEKKQPFLLIAASTEPHSPHNKGDASKYPPGKIKLSPIQADTPETRTGLSKYFAEITYFDSQVGEILTALEEKGLRQNTFVIVLSEQGYDLPFAKWTCYDAGLHSACVIRWPGQVKPGSTTRAIVEYTDVVPTFLDAAGLPVPEGLDGKSFLPVLRGQAEKHRDHTYAQQTSKGIIRGPVNYGIRSIRGERYRYIRNLTPEVTFKNAVTPGKIFQSWVKAGEAGDKHAAKLVHDFQHRPAEELYDCDADPWSRKNLIGEKSLEPVAADLKQRLDTWMKEQGDEGQATEEKALSRMPGKGRGGD